MQPRNDNNDEILQWKTYANATISNLGRNNQYCLIKCSNVIDSISLCEIKQSSKEYYTNTDKDQIYPLHEYEFSIKSNQNDFPTVGEILIAINGQNLLLPDCMRT